MYGYIYLTTNKVNGKKYIGQKKSNKFLENKYLGSGKLLQRAVKKYGKENFSVELIENCKSQSELDRCEKFWIKFYDAVNNNDFYNIADGAVGGNTYKNLSKSQLTKIKLKISKSTKGIPKSEDHKEKHRGVNNINYGKKRKPEDVEKMRKSLKEFYSHNPNPMTGKHHTENTKQLMSKNHADVSGKNNPMFGKSHPNKGKVYINNEKETKLIAKQELQSYMSEGWKRGRLK